MANVLGELFQDIADAIRSKTGGMEPMAPASFPENISAIKTNGFAEGVHYVTFMSQDGTTELYKRPVADGDDCADPITRGYISKPTKESTVQYDYSFVGWATTPNGAWDENALKAVTEDKTVYATFAAAVRYYTVTYYDEDGTTVLKTEQLAYGTTPSYVPSQNGYSFNGWTPALATVTGNASYTASWTEIEGIASGTFSSGAKWKVLETGEFIAYGSGAMDSYNSREEYPWWDIRNSITSVIIENGVTSIGVYAFALHSKITSVSIADSVTQIGRSAFWSASSLTEVTIPASVVNLIDSFIECKNLSSVTLSEGIQKIDGTFKNCTALTRVTIPASVTSIGIYSFNGCSSLQYAYFTNLTTWYVGDYEGDTKTKVTVSSPSTAARYLRETYGAKCWTKV